MSSKKNRYTQFDDGNSDRVNIDDESSSNDGNKNHQGLANAFEIMDGTDIEANQTPTASIGEPRRLIHLWLRVMLITLYLVLSIGAIYVMADNEISDAKTYAAIFITIITPTILIMIIFIYPKCMPFISFILLIIVIILRTVQWIVAIIYAIDIETQVFGSLFAILGALLNECGFLCIVLMDFYVFYIQKDYDNAIFSVHYNPQKAVRLTSLLLFVSSILWFIYCFGTLGDQTQFIDTWFYLLLGIATAMFLVFEYLLAPKWGNKIGFILCCIVMLLILFIWGDDQLLSFSDLATAAILPQLMCLTFAYFKKFAAECM